MGCKEKCVHLANVISVLIYWSSIHATNLSRLLRFKGSVRTRNYLESDSDTLAGNDKTW